jgi:hypothetical protein
MLFAAIGFNFTGYTSSVTETPRHFTVTANPTVVINNDIGSIRVQAGGAGSDVTVQAFKNAGFGGNVNDVQVSYNQNIEANNITVNLDRTTNVNFFNSPSVNFVVTVPNNTGLELKTNTGSITFIGSISQTGSYQFTTNTGSVNVTLPASSVFHVDATTDTGSITSDFSGVNVQHPNFTSAVAHGDVGSSPQAMVTMRTNTGSIYLHTRHLYLEVLLRPLRHKCTEVPVPHPPFPASPEGATGSWWR